MPTSNKPRILIGLAIAGLVTAAAVWDYRTHLTSRANQNINATIPSKNNKQKIPIQSEIHGKILKIYVNNNQTVKQGDVLIELDPYYYTVSVEQAKAQLAEAKRISKEYALTVQEAKALVDQRQAELAQQEAVYKRKEALATKGYFPKQQVLEAATQMKAAQTAVILAKTHLEKVSTMTDPTLPDPIVTKASADLERAVLDLDRTKILAPTDGIIVDCQLVTNQVISAHQPLFTLEPSKKAQREIIISEQPVTNAVKQPSFLLH